MPTRYIKESACTSPNLARLTAEAERCYWRLITKADDYGRFNAEPNVVVGGCFPLYPTVLVNAEKVKTWLREMVAARLIRLYRTGGRQFGSFLTWERHQGKPRAKGSKYPEPPAVTRIRGQVRAVADTSGQLRASAPRIRSSYSESFSYSGDNGPQPIGAIFEKSQDKIFGKAQGS